MRLALPTFLSLVLAVSAAAQSSPLFTVTRLGNLGGSTTMQPYALNDSGLVVGYANSSTQTNVNGFMYSGGFTSLGTLGGPQSRALGVNNAGTIVGWSNFSSGSGNYRAFSYRNGVMTDLGTLGGPLSQANDINEAGVIVGTSGNGTTTHAFRYANGVMTDLGTLIGAAGVSYANAINESGQIAGRSNASATADHAVLWTGNTLLDLGSLSGASGQSEAMGLNDLGWVVGNSTFNGGTLAQRHAFLYANGAMTDLGSLGGSSWATDINNAGQIVGYSYLANGTTLRPFFYDYSTATMRDLTTVANFAGAGFNLTYGLGQIWDINEAGQIAGWGITNQFTYEAFLLTPLTAPTPLSAVPEPATNAALCGALVFGLAVWRRRVAARNAIPPRPLT
jgi:probable HAF family extracellular repeat protein